MRAGVGPAQLAVFGSDGSWKMPNLWKLNSSKSANHGLWSRCLPVLGLLLGFALTSIAAAQDKNTTAPQPPPSNDPQSNLSDLENVFLDIMAKLDPTLARKIGTKLSQKNTPAAKSAYLARRRDKIFEEASALGRLLKDKDLADKSKSKELHQMSNRYILLDHLFKGMILYYQTEEEPGWYLSRVGSRRMKDVCSYITDSSWREVCYQDFMASYCISLTHKGDRIQCMRVLGTARKGVRFGRTIWDFCSLTPRSKRNGCFAFGAAVKEKCKEVPTKPGKNLCLSFTQAVPDDARLSGQN